MEYLDTKYFSYADPNDPIHRKALIRSIEFVSGQPYLYNIYREYQKNPKRWDSFWDCLLYTSPSPRDVEDSRMPSSA